MKPRAHIVIINIGARSSSVAYWMGNEGFCIPLWNGEHILVTVYTLPRAGYTGCFTTLGHYCSRWLSRSLWPERSYKHVSDFGRLRIYGHLLIPVHVLELTASYVTSSRVMYSTWWLIVCVASIIFATWLAHPATDSPVFLSRHLEGI